MEEGKGGRRTPRIRNRNQNRRENVMSYKEVKEETIREKLRKFTSLQRQALKFHNYDK